jgi:site-specific DNA-methyltransferase (adenine-specific)
MQVVYKPLSEIKPYANNPRKNEAAVGPVAESIRKFGFQQPIVLDKGGVIVAGDTRYKAAKLLGLMEAPCVVADDLSEEEAQAYRLADNKTGEIAEWDFGLLDIEIGALQEIDMALFGFDFGTEEGGMAAEDDFVPEMQGCPAAKRGEIYRLGPHRLMCGDATDGADMALLMGGQMADMVFADPPYGVSYADKNSFLNSIDNGNRIQEPIEGDHGRTEETGELVYKAFCEINKRLAEYSSYYITSPASGGLLLLMMTMMQKAGIPLRHCLVWVKNNHVLGRTDYNYKHEPILYGWKGRHRFYGKGDHKFSTWEIDKPLKNDLHPTMKPVALIANALLNSTKEGDAVLDPFGGSGSTLIACEKLGRVCHMMEIDPKYCGVTISRWETFTGKKAVLVE